MARTQADLGEMIGKIFDRLEKEHQGYEISDAIVVVEIEEVDASDGEGDGTILIQSTTKRPSTQYGLLRWGQDCVFDGEGEDDI